MAVVATGGFLHCRICGCLSQAPEKTGHFDRLYCPRCGAKIPTGPNNSIEVTWALLIAAAIMYIPANLMPVMSVYMFGAGQPDTIVSGVIHLVQAG
ncbi:MAG: paraquat-inducible membrane protein A, partial [Thiothrix nivea]